MNELKTIREKLLDALADKIISFKTYRFVLKELRRQMIEEVCKN